MNHSDICIAGAGIIGLSLALELHARGASVVVVDSGEPMREASFAAAGMLAVSDPHNPGQLSSFSHYSASLYPEFLNHLHALSGFPVPFQTHRTLQALGDGPVPALTPEILGELLLDYSHTSPLDPTSGFEFLREQSIDPRQLASALMAAVEASSIRTIYNSPVIATTSTSSVVRIDTASASIEASHFVDCTGAWANSRENDAEFKAIPIKGQMLALELPADLPLRTTVRTKDIYIVPRVIGPSAGRAIVGATVEDVGFDKTVHESDIGALREKAAALLPGLAHARVVDSWAGLRPSTLDRLPLVGAHPHRPNHWLATGHYRNGILLAPGTSRVVADLIAGVIPAVSIDSFRPMRFVPVATPSPT